MITYNKTLIEYFKQNDTEFKKFLNEKFEKSSISSFIQFMDGFFYKIGLISTNIKPIEGSKWDSQYTLSIDNVFSKEPGDILVTDIPVHRKQAEEKLSKVVIELFTCIDMGQVNEKVTS